jgi:hypothetical protein
MNSKLSPLLAESTLKVNAIEAEPWGGATFNAAVADAMKKRTKPLGRMNRKQRLDRHGAWAMSHWQRFSPVSLWGQRVEPWRML